MKKQRRKWIVSKDEVILLWFEWEKSVRRVNSFGEKHVSSGIDGQYLSLEWDITTAIMEAVVDSASI